MGDVDESDLSEVGGFGYRLIGDLPYLLVEFRSTGQDVVLEFCANGIDCEMTKTSLRAALQDIIRAVGEAEDVVIPP